MRKYLKGTLTATASALLGLTMLSGAASAEEWKFALEEVQGSVQDAYAQKFKELIEEKTNGEVTVNVYPYGTLGTSGQLTELTASGVLQLANASPGHLGSLVPEVQVFSIPYLLSENDEVNKKVLNESETIYGEMGGALEGKGLQLLTMYPEGEMVWTTNREIRKPEDFKNFKMRVMQSPMLTTAYKAFGANPTPMPYSEVYSGLQLKMIDGQVNPIFAIEEMKFYEVSDYMIWAGQQEFTTTVVANNAWYDGLPADRKQDLYETLAEMTDYIFEKQRQYNQERLEKIKKAKPELKMIRLTDEERAVFRERAQALRDKYVEMTGESGKKVLESLVAEIKAAEEEMGAK